MTPEAEKLFLDRLVRAVAKDGSEWWVQPESVKDYESLESAYATDPEIKKSMDAFNKAYWTGKK